MLNAYAYEPAEHDWGPPGQNEFWLKEINRQAKVGLALTGDYVFEGKDLGTKWPYTAKIQDYKGQVIFTRSDDGRQFTYELEIQFKDQMVGTIATDKDGKKYSLWLTAIEWMTLRHHNLIGYVIRGDGE